MTRNKPKQPPSVPHDATEPAAGIESLATMQAADGPPLRLEWRSPAELAANPRNWRRHPESQQAALAGVLSEVGWAGACLLNETTGLLIDGHLRQKVALANGAEKIPVLIGAWTPEQEAKILATLDPLASMAEADPVALDALLRDVNTGCEELQQMLADLWEDNKPPDEPAAPIDEDTPPEPRADVVTRPGDLWTIGPHRLLCGDCRDPAAWERLLGGEQVDLLLTDPPYGIGIAANPVRQKHEKRDWDNQPVSSEDIARLLGIAETTIIWGGNYFGLPASQGFYIWDKGQPEEFSTGMCEMAWTSIQEPARIYRERVVGYHKDHPTQKPVGLMAWCIERCGDAQLIADPYVGSGTTIMACEALGRRCFACEIEPAYVDVCLRRYVAKYPDADPVRHDGTKWSELTT
jgi:site-specific DNA-methyltransferase (adenine-specific)/modification methylase